MRRTAHPCRQSAGLNACSARGVMMKIRNSDLHTERKKRQPKQPQAKSRDGHRIQCGLPGAEVDRSCVTIVATAILTTQAQRSH